MKLALKKAFMRMCLLGKSMYLLVLQKHLISCFLFNKCFQHACQTLICCQQLLPSNILVTPNSLLEVELLFVTLAIWILSPSCELQSRWHLSWFAFIWLFANQVNNSWVILVELLSTSLYYHQLRKELFHLRS